MSRIPRILPLVAVALAGVAAVRLIGAGPDLFQGARAWAEGVTETAGEAASPGQTAAPPPAACAISPEELARQAGLSPAELRILQNLSARRGELDARDVDFDTQLPLLIVAEAKANERIVELNGLRGEINALLGTMTEREQEEVNRLVQVYQAMRPRDAAPVFATLDDEVRLPVAAAMRPRSLSAIMAQMDPAAARILTERLANRFGTQRFAQAAADTATDASAPATGATPGATPPATTTPTPAARQTPRPTPAASQPAATPPARQTTPPRRQTPPRQTPPEPQRETPPAETPPPAATDAAPAEQPRVGVN